MDLSAGDAVIPCEPNFSVHQFSASVLDQDIKFEILKMKDSIYVWIGPRHSHSLENLAVSLPTKYSPLPLSSLITGSVGNSEHVLFLGTKLSRKLNKQVLVSMSFVDPRFVIEVEKALFEYIKQNPEVF